MVLTIGRDAGIIIQRITMTEKTESHDLKISEAIDNIKAEEARQVFATEKAARREELSSYIRACFDSSAQWRETSFEPNWDKWHRNARSIYDPELKNKKEDWQITMFVPMTIKHKERAKSQIFKTMVGMSPQFDIEIRPGGEADQAEMVKDLILYYMDKAQFELGFNDQVDQGCTYGTGLSKAYWQTIKERRRIRKINIPNTNILEKLRGLISGAGLKDVSYKTEETEIETFDGVRFSYVDIHDVFPDPKDPTFKRSWVIHRDKMSYGELMTGAQNGWYDKETVNLLKDVKESEQPKSDKQVEKADLGETTPTITRTDYGKIHTVLEFWGRLPRKWIYPDKAFKDGEGDEMIPAKCLYAYEGRGVLECVENDDYTGDNPFDKLDYIRLPGLHYGIGIPELLWAIQEEINELRNQRVDNGVIAMNHMNAVMDDALIDENDFISKPGGCVRIKGRRSGGYEDIRQAFTPLPVGTVPGFSYQETMELEREAQELTGVNRVTLGTGGQFAKDSNQTATGMNLLKQSSLELMNYYANIMELSAFVNIIRHFYVLIYKNITPAKLEKILGPERAAKFVLLPVEELEQYYRFKPTGTFTMTNKLQKAQSLMQFKALYEESPFIKPIALAKRIARLLEIEDPDEIMMTDEEFQNKMAEMQSQLPPPGAEMPGPIGQMPEGMGQPPGVGGPMPQEMMAGQL